jgi:hypothetical protein
MGLSEITGMGFGKALEFLVKDFAVSQQPEKTEEIKQSFLGSCLKEYVDDPRVAQVAEKATWLRNDETHYVRKWADKDIHDLKTLLSLTVRAVESTLITNKYLEDMKDGKK